MAYSEKDFQSCEFNPFSKLPMLEQYPRIKEIVDAEWISEYAASIDNILRFVVIVYDKNSPLRQNERDSLRRKNIAYDLAGFDRLENGEPDEVIVNETHPIIFMITVRYLAKFIKSKEYAALCAFEFKYYENIMELMTPIKGDTNAERLEAAKKKSVISEEIVKDIKIIDDLWLGFFGEKTLVEKVKAKKFIPEMMH